MGASLVTLPGRRKGKAPTWPLSKASSAESALWGSLWRSPQAVEWERLAVERVVARYCRLLVRVEGDEGASTRLLNEVRQLEDRLGLNPVALLRLRWRIDGADSDGEPGNASQNVIDIRERIHAVDP
jgi:hypothetical protein